MEKDKNGLKFCNKVQMVVVCLNLTPKHMLIKV